MIDDLTQQDATAQGDTATGEGGAGEREPQGSQATTSWLDSLPDDLKGNDDLKAFKDPSEVAKALLDAKAKAIEVPEAPDAYQVEVPEGFPLDQNFLASAKDWAHKAGLSKAQFEAFAKPYVEAQAAMIAQLESEQQQGIDSLKAEWGPSFAENDKLATEAVKRFGGEDLMKALVESGAAKKPAVVKAFLAIQKAISEDKLIEGDGANVPKVQYTQAGTPSLGPYKDMPRQ